MDYRLTLHSLVIGSLAFCLTVLAIAGVLEWLRPVRRRTGYGTRWYDDGPAGDGRRRPDFANRPAQEIAPVGVLEEAHSAGEDNGRARRGETGRELLRLAG
jgi:hypothetical protein